MAERTGPRDDVHRWGPAAWTLWAVSVVVGILAALLIAVLVTWKAGAGCGHLATPANVRDGLTGLGVGSLVLGAPWGLAALVAFVSSRRWRPLVSGLIVTVLPLAVVAATHTHPADWNGGGFCF